MLNKLKQFFDDDFKYVEKGLEDEQDTQYRNDICWNARQRALGAMLMAKRCGLDSTMAEQLFDDYCNKLELAECL